MQVNAKTMWTVKTEIDFDDDDGEEFLGDNNENEDNNSIDLIDEENKDENKKLKKMGNRGTMVFEGSEVDFSKNIHENKENKMNNNEIDNKINIEKNSEKINNIDNLRSIVTEKKKEDCKSESIIIEDESINDDGKNKDNLITNEANL